MKFFLKISLFNYNELRSIKKFLRIIFPAVSLTASIIAGIFFAVIPFGSQAQVTAHFKNKELPVHMSLMEFCKSEPEAVEQFFGQVNLDYPGLDSTRIAIQSKDWLRACNTLIYYYQSRKKNSWLLNSPDGQTANSFQLADSALADNFTFQDVSGKIQRLANGNINWNYKGPKQDVEWAYFLNRHFFLIDLENAYKKSGDEKYITCYSNLMMDWIVSNPVYLQYNHNPAWRPLEAGIRVGRSWVKTFLDLQPSKQLSDVTRLLMLMSFYDHAWYLNNFHGRHHNHAVSELISLAKVALNFPEFKQANSWYNEAVKGMKEEFNYSAYPDGAVKELTSHYHSVVAREFSEFIFLNTEFKKTLPVFFNSTLESMYNYIAYTARTDSMGLLNNDSDLDNNFDVINTVNLIYKRPDWDYIISNGKTGQTPKQTSIMFPWAGQLLMRNGYGEKAGKDQFAFFDIGPWGTTHQHNDKLHFSVYAGGRELLCDNGRMYYKWDSIRSYFNLSTGHNVIALDGQGQNATKQMNTEPVDSSQFSIQKEVDFAMGVYEDGFRDSSENAKPYPLTKKRENISGKHTRAVIYLKNRYWIVVDQVETDTPRELTAYWHFNPDCHVQQSATAVFSDDVNKQNLLIHPVSDLPWKVQLIKGQDEPYVQGWYSEVYNKRVPAYCAAYRTQQLKNRETFAWVMYPSQSSQPPVIHTKVLSSPAGSFRFEVTIAGQPPTEVAINMSALNTIQLSGNAILKGRCAILQKGARPMVIHGKIMNAKGMVLVESE